MYTGYVVEGFPTEQQRELYFAIEAKPHTVPGIIPHTRTPPEPGPAGTGSGILPGLVTYSNGFI